jgi:hypothetical protein
VESNGVTLVIQFQIEEWLSGLKHQVANLTTGLNRSVGSNPTSSATSSYRTHMIRAITTALLLSTATAAAAENWQLVQDSENGSRLIADFDSVDVTNYIKNEKTKEVGIRAHGVMEVLTPDGPTGAFTAIIDVDDCLKRQAGPIVNLFADGKTNTYFWSSRGDRLYDAQGQWLCAIVTIANATVEAKKSKEKPKYSM